MRDFGTRGQRSRSPIRRRSPSPNGRRFRSQQQSSSNNAQRGRSRSPLRQQYSPKNLPPRPRGRSPVFFGSNAVVFDANNARRDVLQPRFGQTNYIEPQIPSVLQGVNLFRPFLQENVPGTQQQAAPGRQGSQSIASMTSSKTMGFGSVTRAPLAQKSGNTASQNSGSSNMFGQVQQSGPKPNGPPEPEVEDPYFVLGVRMEALEAEIIEAYQKRMWEVEIERRADVGYTTAPGTNNVWDESVAILRAAKKKLVGY
ncbi:hypothetical protein CJF32_00010061 [Rutstroemia sp. NJR-2017a WRK4]|nr:hypothetical protein CJF32_00010061 [Rutstroemia sp. NJR-2017a WRK4]